MKRTTTLLLALLFLLSNHGMLLNAQKVKTVDGTKYIMNGRKPKAPQGIPTKITFEEVLSVGAGDDPEKSFAEVGFFVVSDSGDIYASDVKDRKIKVFDDEGNFVRILGKFGEGPGEISLPTVLQLTPKNEIMVEDAANRKLSFFTLGGEFLRDLSFADKGLALTTLFMDGRGNFAGRMMGVEGQKAFFELVKFDPEMNPLFAVGKTPFEIPQPGSGNKMNMFEFIVTYAFDPQGRLFYAPNKDYELQVFDAEGAHVLSIQKDYKPVKVTDEDIEEIEERLSAFSGMAGGANLMDLFEFPKLFPPYQGFFLDDESRIYVRTWEKGEGEDEFWTDVFDKEGNYFTRFVHRSELRIIKGDTAYGVEENEDGFRLIKKYKVAWSR
jgi:hypothetical protein